VRSLDRSDERHDGDGEERGGRVESVKERRSSKRKRRGRFL